MFSDQETQLKSIRASIAATQASIARTQSDLTKLEDFAIKNELSMGLVKRMRSMESEIARYEAKLAQLHEDERKELLQRATATDAAEQIQSLRTDTDPLMRTKLRSQIRSLVAQIVIHLPARKITMRYAVKADTFEQKSRIIFKDGKSMDMIRDMVPA